MATGYVAVIVAVAAVAGASLFYVRSVEADAGEIAKEWDEADAVAAAKSEENLLGTAGDLLGAFLGGRSGSTALRKASTRRTATAKAQAKAETEAAKYHAKHTELAELENELAAEVEEVTGRFEEMAAQIETFEVSLEKNDIRVAEIRLLWIPV